MSRRRIDWSQWDHLLGTMSDAEVAKRIGCRRHTVIVRRSRLGVGAFSAINGRVPAIDWDAQPLGQVTDLRISMALTAELGVRVSHARVWRQRTIRGIPAAHSDAERVDWDAQPLGQISDDELADRLGVCSKTVFKRRRERGIQARYPKRSKSG